MFDPVELDIVCGGVERVLRLGYLVVRRALCGDGAVHLLPSLIQQFDSGEAFGY